MRRGVGLVAAVLAVSVLGCSSGDAITIEVLYPVSVYGEQVIESVPFRTLGADIDDTVLCESGTTNRDHIESPEGEIITSEEGESCTKPQGPIEELWTPMRCRISSVTTEPGHSF